MLNVNKSHCTVIKCYKRLKFLPKALRVQGDDAAVWQGVMDLSAGGPSPTSAAQLRLIVESHAAALLLHLAHDLHLSRGVHAHALLLQELEKAEGHHGAKRGNTREIAHFHQHSQSLQVQQVKLKQFVLDWNKHECEKCCYNSEQHPGIKTQANCPSTSKCEER